MKNEPQIFTRTDDQNVPVDDAILGALEQEELSESLVREYISGLLVEQDEEEQTPEQKIMDLFLKSPSQAVELGEQLSLDPEIMKPMRQILDASHELIGLAHEKFESGPRFGSSGPSGGSAEDRLRVAKADKAILIWQKAYYVLRGWDRVGAKWGDNTLFDLFGKSLMSAIEGYNNPWDSRSGEEVVNDAVNWAGEPLPKRA